LAAGKEPGSTFKETRMRIQTILLPLILTGLMFSSAGCLVAAVGAGAAGTVAYLAGDLETEVSEDLDTVYAASRKALNDLGLSVIAGKGGKDALSATLVARDAEDKKVEIRLKSVTDEMTELSIRVGVFGDEIRSRHIYNKIVDNLGTTQ
jgi:hypothetical protein